jgi:hypothetical protein
MKGDFNIAKSPSGSKHDIDSSQGYQHILLIQSAPEGFKIRISMRAERIKVFLI